MLYVNGQANWPCRHWNLQRTSMRIQKSPRVCHLQSLRPDEKITAKRRTEDKNSQEESRLKSELAAQFITLMGAKAIPTLDDRSVVTSPAVIVAMASFTSEKDPWTTKASNNCAEILLNMSCQNDLWSVIERVLREKIRPLFTKTKNPAITSEGRKNLHPVPRTRFDGGALDDSTKPWKTTDVYAPAVLSWIICQYKV
jgi:hypothetical protein